MLATFLTYPYYNGSATKIFVQRYLNYTQILCLKGANLQRHLDI